MIELTTGVVFLMSSLYGAGHANTNIASVGAAVSENGKATTTVMASSLNNLKINDVEAYVRKEYADVPILIEIARCESRFHQFNDDGTVVRGISNAKDVGIMQINEKYHADTALNKGYDIYSVEGNVAFGKYLYSKYGTSPWNYSSKCWSAELAQK